MLNSTLFTISMHILHTALDTFPMVPLKRINLKIKHVRFMDDIVKQIRCHKCYCSKESSVIAFTIEYDLEVISPKIVWDEKKGENQVMEVCSISH